MSYDEFGNMTRVGVINLTLATYTYNNNNGKVESMTYGNGDSVEYKYDTLDRIEKICYKESGENDYTTKYEYKYDSNGYLHTLYDYESGQTVSYKYDASGRLVEYYVNDDASYTDQSCVVNEYDNEGRIRYQDYRRDYKYNGGLNTLVSSAEFTYNTDNSLGSMRKIVSGTAYSLNYSYDNLGRLTGTSTVWETDSIVKLTVNQNYTYATSEFADDYDNTHYNTVSSQVTGVSTSVNGVAESYTYTYNNVGYITHIYRNGSLAYSYSYDDLGQLTRENNADTNRTYVYTYDTTGNILSKKVYGYTTSSSISTTLYNTYTYTYGNTDWNDLLQGYNGVNFSHDDIGNPLSYYNGSPYTFTWKQGRRLETAQVNGYELTFTYNDEGVRTSKDVNGVTHYYHLAGSQILSEEWTENGVTHLLVYNYDADGTIMGMSYRNSTYDVQRFDNYLFVKNIQGDVLHIYDENGTKVVSYLYDAWGNITSTTGSAASTIGKMNPFRYRGYYYDEELGFYYLNSRYYDPKIGRFINADSALYSHLLGFNLFAFCYNNPINYIDPYGNSGFSAALASWTSTGWLAALAEPTIIGEIVYIGGCAVLGTLAYAETVILADIIVNVVEEYDNKLSTEKNKSQSSNEKTKKKNGKKTSKKSGKEKANDKLSWTNPNMINKNETAQQNATRMLNDKYGPGNWKEGAGSEYNKIVKWIQRGGYLNITIGYFHGQKESIDIFAE